MTYYTTKSIFNERYMNDFHNFIKQSLLSKYTNKTFKLFNGNIVDIGSGRGGDLNKLGYIKNLEKYLGFDLYIEEALKRLEKKPFLKGKVRYIQMNFLNWVDKSDNEELFSLMCFFFSFHYFFSPVFYETLGNNINKFLRSQSFIIITVMDGDLIKDKLSKCDLVFEYSVMSDINKNKEFRIKYKDCDSNEIAVYNSDISRDWNNEYLVFRKDLINFFERYCNAKCIEENKFSDVFENPSLLSCVYYTNDMNKYYRDAYETYKNELKSTGGKYYYGITSLYKYYVFEKTVFS